jgi:hypothetical protein
MNDDPFASLAVARADSARAALATAFGRARIGPIVALSGGATTASVYRIEVGEQRYLLRIEGQPSPLRNPHQYVSMRIAAEAGIAPKILYVDETARIVVADFIEQVALEAYPGGPPALARALGELLARVQATEVFPYLSSIPISSPGCLHMCAEPVFLRAACSIDMWSGWSCSADRTERVQASGCPAITMLCRTIFFSTAGAFG